jgi:hypothetical protein
MAVSVWVVVAAGAGSELKEDSGLELEEALELEGEKVKKEAMKERMKEAMKEAALRVAGASR